MTITRRQERRGEEWNPSSPPSGARTHAQPPAHMSAAPPSSLPLLLAVALALLPCLAVGQYYTTGYADSNAIAFNQAVQGADTSRAKPTPGAMATSVQGDLQTARYDDLLKVEEQQQGGEPGGRRRRLQAAKQEWEKIGRYAIVVNPEMPGARPAGRGGRD